MLTSRRNALAGAATSSTTLETIKATPAIASEMAQDNMEQIVTALLAQSAAGHTALMQGDADGFYAEITPAHDFTLMSPFGGAPSHGPANSPEQTAALGRFFRNGTFAQELVQSYASPDMVVLAVIERTYVKVGGLPAQDWPLRVTLVYRRDGPDWRLVHRHADPLVPGISLDQAAALARGAAD